jgi:hypothetical protein
MLKRTPHKPQARIRPPHAQRSPVVRAYVYFSAPRLLFATQHYQRALDSIRTHWPQAQIVESRRAFANVNDWRRHWPLFLEHVRVLVFMTDPHGYIGRGVWREINDAQVAGVPVLYVNETTGRLHGLGDTDFSAPDSSDWHQHVRVTLRPLAER